MRRVIPVLAALLFAGCFSSSADSAGADPDPDSGGGAAPAECSVAADCTAAGSSCCECPTFAVSRDSGWEDSCEDVTCDSPPSDCSAAAACEQGACVLRCAEVVCAGDLQCEGGPSVDAVGCLSCACAGADPLSPMPECVQDADCVQVAADCCGCALGGTDTAVPVGEAGNFTDGLGCSGNTTCPGVDVCDAEVGPRCNAGQCVLSAAPTDTEEPDAGVGDQLCGSAALPPCPTGSQCVLNASDAPAATQQGLGVCRP